MAIPAFGFSVGDFIAAIELIGKAAKALKETSGATKQYRQAALELEGLVSVLRQVQALRPTNRTDETIRKIHLCAHVCYLPLQAFLAVVQKLEPSLGTPNHTLWPQQLKAAVKKIQWAILLEKELAKLKTSIGPSLTSINLLLQLESIERGNETQDFTQRNYAAAQDLFLQVDALKSSVLQQVDRLATRDQVAMLTQLIQALSVQNMNAVSPLLAASHQATIRMEGRLDGIDQYVQQVLATKLNAGVSLSVSTSQDHILSSMYRRFDDIESLIRHSKARDLHGVSQSSMNTGTSGQSFVPHQTPWTVNLRSWIAGSCEPHSGSEGRAIARATQAVIDAIHQRFNEILGLFVLFLGLHKFLRTAWTILRAPSLLLDSNIELEDALGRKMSLQFCHFHIWSHVQAKLELDFRGLPGELWVKQRSFQFDVLTQYGRRLLTWEEWDASIKPGSRVLMAMRLSTAIEGSQECPNCSTVNGIIEGRSDIDCTKCGLAYVPLLAQPSALKETTSITDGTSPNATSSSTGQSEISNSEASEGNPLDSLSDTTTTSDHFFDHSTDQVGSDDGMRADIGFFKRVHVLGPPFQHSRTLLQALDQLRREYSDRGQHRYSSFDIRQDWALEIVEAVAEQHRRGRVHPALTLETVYIDDNGTARLAGAEPTVATPPLWLPPEIARYKAGAQFQGTLMNRMGNIYQLGVIMYAMAELETAPKVITVRRLRAQPRLPYLYRKVVASCLELAPSKRPSAAELLRSFQTKPQGLFEARPQWNIERDNFAGYDRFSPKDRTWEQIQQSDLKEVKYFTANVSQLPYIPNYLSTMASRARERRRVVQQRYVDKMRWPSGL